MSKRYCGMCDELVNRDAYECPACGADTDAWHDEDRDEDYERAVARARGNDYADTDGRDWS